MSGAQKGKATGSRKVVLLVDDDEGFLLVNEGYWLEYYREEVEVFLMNPEKGENPVTWIKNRLSNKMRLDAVFLDKNMLGKNGLRILEEIRQLDQARYLPIAMMTMYPDEADDAEALDIGAARSIYKTSAGERPIPFLQEALRSLIQLRDKAEDDMWIDLLREVNRQAAQDRELRNLVDHLVAPFLKEHFGDSVIYVREHNGATLHLLGTYDPYQAGKEVPVEMLPYLIPLLDPQGPLAVREAALTVNYMSRGRRERLIGQRFVGVPLIQNGDRVGTLTLYRTPDLHPFRRKDEFFLQHLALEITSRLATERTLRQLRQRQTKFANFVRSIADAENEKAACELLADFLHQEIHGGDNLRSKTTVRLLQSGQPEIPRVSSRGLPLLDPDPVENIYQKESVYTEVIWKRHSVLYSDITNEDLWCYPEARSRLTIPLLSSDLCLGAVNMEHFSPDSYTTADKEFSEAITGLTAQTLLNLKSRRFTTSLLTLVNELLHPQGPLTEDMLTRAFALLHDFTGYAFLFYLVPKEIPYDPDNPWKVERGIGSNGKLLDAGKIQRWQEGVEKNWGNTFIRKTLKSPDRQYTDEKNEIVSDLELDVKTEAMEVVHLHNQADQQRQPSGIIALGFLLPKSVNPFQRQQLTAFSQVIGTLLETKASIKRLLDQKSLAEQEATLGQVLGQFRHSLRSQLGLLNNALSEAKRMGATGEWLQRARDILSETDEGIENSRVFVKLPEYRDFAVDDVWRRVISKISALARRKSITLQEWASPEPLSWKSDPDIVGLILENLVLNAVEQCRSGDTVGLRVSPSADSLCLTVFDSGPGVPKTIRPKLFEPGVTSKPGGTGFGLRFSRLRACDLQGNLRVEPDDQTGAAFSLILPRHPKT